MKSVKILASALAVVALALTGCVKTDLVETGIDVNKPGVTELTYAEVAHASKGITVLWDAADAVAAGATSFTVQMVTDKSGGSVDMYDASKGTSVSVEKDENGVPTKTNYSATVSGQNIGDIFYVRVRVNYPHSIFSQWAFLSDAQGNIVRYKVGRGVIPDGALETPYLYKVTPTSTGIIVKWDTLPGVEKYIIEYKKAADADWTPVELGKEEVNYKINGLPSVTAFQVRAKADYGSKGASAYCETVDVTTRQPGSYPAQMTTKEQLIAWLEGGVVEVEAAQTFEIMNDIDLGEEVFSAMDEPLMGTFNGNGHKITGVSSNLFDTNEGTIKNVIVEGKGIKLEGTPEFGTFIKKNAATGKIENVSVNIPVSFEAAADVPMYIGGFCCYNEGSIKGCTSKGGVTVTAKAAAKELIFIGGIASKCAGTLEDCVNEGAVSYTNENYSNCPAVAGIAAFLNGTAKNCTNKGAVTNSILYSTTASTTFPEEIAGKKSGTATYMTPATGGIVAYSYDEDITKALLDGCVNDGAVTFSVLGIDQYKTTVQRVQAGGIIANPWGLIKNCTNNGSFNVEIKTTKGSASEGTYLTCCGGIGGGDWFPGAPNDQAATTYDGCVNNGEINYIKFDKVGSSNSTLGGICGWPGLEGSRTNETKNCINNGNINLSGTGKMRAGGIHGGSGKVTSCENYGKVYFQSGDPASAIGGLSGFSSNGFKLTKSKSMGTVISDVALTSGAGGAVGNLGNVANSGGFADCIISCKVVNPEATNEKTGMLIGYYNGTSANVPIATPKVNGVIVINGKSTVLTAGNYEGYLVGTANASASTHTIASTFYGVPYVDPDGPAEEEPTTKLDTPKNVAISILYNSVTISWDAVENAEWYVVEYKKKTDEAWQSTARIEDKTSVTIEGLAHGTDYDFRVKAFSAVSSDYSDVVEQTTLEEVVFSKPVLSAGTIEATSFVVNWAAIDKAKGYKLQYKLAADAEFTMAPVELAADVLTYTVKGLKPETDYEVRVKAVGEGGNEGEYCDAFAVKTDVLTITYPYTINTIDDFELWVSAANLCTATDEVILGADIDLSGKTFSSIPAFAGIFNGNSKSIKGLSAPLFSTLTGTVKNLTAEGAISSTVAAGETSAGHPLAAIALVSTGTITDCINKCSITMTCSGIIGSPVLAGVAAYQKGGTFKGNKNYGAITLTHGGTANAAISGFNRKPFVVAAGVLGVLVEGTEEECYNEGVVKVGSTNVPGIGARHYIGGILGTPENSTVVKCINKGDVTADFEDATKAAAKQVWVGGIVGGRNGDCSTVDGADIDQCDNYGVITLISSNSVNSYLAGISAQGTIEATSTTITSAMLKKITNCNNYGKLVKKGEGGARVGGISGGAATIDKCTNSGEIVIDGMEAGRAVGGLVGYPTQSYHPVTDSKNTGNITSNADTAFAIGGLFGQGGNTVQNYAGCSVNCVMTTKTNNTAGMIVGTAKTLASSRTITYGTSEKPCKIKGTFNGTVLTAENYKSYIASDGVPGEDGKIVTATGTGYLVVENVIFGE